MPNELPLKALRETKGLTQRTIAKKLGIERSRIVRLEKKTWSKVSLGELEIYSSGLGIKIEELFSLFKGQNGNFKRSSLKKPSFVIDGLEGVKFSSFLDEPDHSFIGSLSVNPQKSLSQHQTPQSDLLFCFILEGTLLLNLQAQDHLFKQGECFVLHNPSAYEFYNPHQFRELVAILVCFPSFVRRS